MKIFPGSIEAAFRNGARLDGWDDQLRFEAWMSAFEDTGIDPAGYLESRSMDNPLPWSFIDTGVSPEFLAQELQRAIAGETNSRLPASGNVSDAVFAILIKFSPGWPGRCPRTCPKRVRLTFRNGIREFDDSDLDMERPGI